MPQTQESPSRWPILALAAMLFHFLLLLIQMPWSELKLDSPRSIRVSFEPPSAPATPPAETVPDELLRMEPKTPTDPTAPPLDRPPSALPPQPQAEPSKEEEEPAAPLSPDEKAKPELEELKTSPQFPREIPPREPAPPIPEPAAAGLERIKPTTSFGGDENAPKPPEKAEYHSDVNSHAANPDPQPHLPEGDPFNAKGETNELAEFKRPGEREADEATKDPTKGSVAREGTPNAGLPLTAPDAPKTEPPPPEPALPLAPKPDEPKLAEVKPPLPSAVEPDAAAKPDKAEDSASKPAEAPKDKPKPEDAVKPDKSDEPAAKPEALETQAVGEGSRPRGRMAWFGPPTRGRPEGAPRTSRAWARRRTGSRFPNWSPSPPSPSL
ncbi:MAG: hypothetical protein M5U26_00320 [Planctomycetota bacterium]|nr:hypothetical protein [Planctomycetota bacterium]